jgi:hypothetical protein
VTGGLKKKTAVCHFDEFEHLLRPMPILQEALAALGFKPEREGEGMNQSV